MLEMKQLEWTVTELRKQLSEITQDNPDGLNPLTLDKSTCLYTSIHDPEWHCLIGELVHRLGWNVPGPEYVGGARTAARVFDWPVGDEAREYLDTVQHRADYGARWGDVEL